MKIGTLVIVLLFACGCLAKPRPRSWSFADLANAEGEMEQMQDSTGFGFSVSRKTVRDVISAHSRIQNVIKEIVAIDAELLIVEALMPMLLWLCATTNRSFV
jgi:hypothetical protein